MAKGICISCQEDKELNENNTCEDCNKEVEEKIDEVIEDSNNNNPAPAPIVVSTSEDNLKTVVEERNKQAKEAKDILEDEPNEEEVSKPSSILKNVLLVVGVGLIGFGAIGMLRQPKQAQNIGISGNGEIRNES